MTESLSLALQISLVGMALVFGAILLLWGIMSLLLRFTAERGGAREEGEEPAVEAAEPVRTVTGRVVAAAAVAAALALERDAARHARRALHRPPAEAVSPWQTVMRGSQIKQRRPVR